MTGQVTSITASNGEQRAEGFSLAASMRVANAVGLRGAYRLFGLFGDDAKALGADDRVGRREML